MSYVPSLFYGLMFFRERINFTFRRVHDGDFLFFRNCSGLRHDDQFIDIGGNYGQSALSYAILDRKRTVVSFEPNRTLEPYLKTVKRMLGERYRYYLIGIGDKASELELFVPKLNRVMLTGEASFDPEEVGSEMVRQRIGFKYTLSKSQCTIERFDDIVDKFHLRPYVIKIDIQGYELLALQGMSESIRKFQPIFMLERNNDSQFEEIRTFFNEYGYEIWYYAPAANKLLRTDPGISPNYFAFPGGMVARDFPGLTQSGTSVSSAQEFTK